MNQCNLSVKNPSGFPTGFKKSLNSMDFSEPKPRNKTIARSKKINNSAVYNQKTIRIMEQIKSATKEKIIKNNKKA